MNRIDERTGLEVLPVSESLTLLAGQAVGRLAVIVAGRPAVFPVGYSMDGRDIVFRTAAGTKLWAARGQAIAFEVDATDPACRMGWSVVVSGVAEEVTRPDELRRLHSLPLRPWTTPATADHWMRIHPTTVTGRRIVSRPGQPAHVAAGHQVVASLPVRPVVAVAEDATLAQVGDAMVEGGVSVVLIGDRAVTEEDLARAVARGHATSDAAAEHAGRRELVLASSASLAEAVQVMLGAGVRHIVVVDMGRAIGTLALADTLEALLRAPELPAWMPALRLALRVQP